MLFGNPEQKRRRGRPSKKELEAEERRLDPETYRSILGISLIVIGFIFLLSIFGAAGKMGDFLIGFLRTVFGYASFPFPFLCLGIGIVILLPNRFPLKPLTLLGLVVFIIVLPALIHLVFVPKDVFLSVAEKGAGGGFIGFGIGSVFLYIFDFWASIIILLGIFVISLLLILDVSFWGLREKFRSLLIRAGFISETEEELEEKEKVGFFARLRQKRKKAKKEEKDRKASSRFESDKDWTFPPINLLNDRIAQPSSGNIKKNKEIIEKTLKNFNIEVTMGDVNIGPTVTQYTLRPKTGVKLNQITARNNDLSLALAAHPIRIEAPIPKRSVVGIEIPNKAPAIVRLRPILESKAFKNSAKKSTLSIALGKDVGGVPQAVNLETMPHLLIAGATGSGKSICLNAIITTFLYNNSPRDLNFILVDPKRVEFTEYNGIPHLLTPVITKPEETISALRWSVAEMDRRYNLLQEKGKRNIKVYNKSVSLEERLPYIVIFIDELADLMAVAAREVEASVVRLAQLARATGLHLVVATQRPSVDVITGLIKANITSRIAFAVASGVDARTILDYSGAERLLGNGDMLFVSPEIGKPKRVQGVFISDKEIKKVTDFLKKKGEVSYDETITSFKPESKTGLAGGEGEDELFDEACEMVLNEKRASATLLQRRFRIGYARAARILDILEEKGIVGPQEGSRPREVLIDPATYQRLKEGKERPLSIFRERLDETEERKENGKAEKDAAGEQKKDNNGYDEELGEM